MKTITLTKTLPLKCGLAEGCVWSAANNAFFWIDIIGKKLFKYTLDTEQLDTFDTPNNPANVMLTDQKDILLVSLFDGLYLFNIPQKTWSLWLEVETDKSLRINDGVVDKNGVIHLGTMLMSPNEKGEELEMGPFGRLFRIDSNKNVSIEIENIAIFNLATFSPEGEYFYYADSFTNNIYRCDYDSAESTIVNHHPFCKLNDSYGHPDGGATDSEGFIWSARWDGKGVARISADGELEQFYPLSTSQITNVCFGGKDLKTLLVTTASLTPEPEVDGGSIQIFQTNVAGIAPYAVRLN